MDMLKIYQIGITCSASSHHGKKVMLGCGTPSTRCSASASMPGAQPKPCHIFTYCCYVRCASLIVGVSRSRVYALALNRRNSLPCTVRTSRQWSCNQMVSCLLCSISWIYDLYFINIENFYLCIIYIKKK